MLILLGIDLYAPMSAGGEGIVAQIANALGQGGQSWLSVLACVLLVLAFYPVFEDRYPTAYCPGLADELHEEWRRRIAEQERFERGRQAFLLIDSDSNILILDAMRRLGARIAMDDFGTGYSSLSYLHRFPIDEIKIDRSFIARLSDAPEARAIVRAVLGLSRELGLRSVAEGVETAEQLDRLRAYGCDLAQGYHFSRPVPAIGIEALLMA